MHILYEINQIVHKVLIKKNVQRIHITLNRGFRNKLIQHVQGNFNTFINTNLLLLLLLKIILNNIFIHFLLAIYCPP